MQDFVELRRDFNSWSAPGVENGKHTVPEGDDANGNGSAHTTTTGHDAEKQHTNGHHPVAAGDRHGVPDHSAHS